MLRIEQDSEALGVPVDLEAIVRTPLCRYGLTVDFDSLEYAPKAHRFRVEEPG
jgi:hypothetical protein